MVLPVMAVPLSDMTGLKKSIDISTGGYDFEVEVVGTFDVVDHDFSADEKMLTIYLESNVEHNLTEIIIPRNLINGEFTFLLDEQQVFPKVHTSDEISFITLSFDGKGAHKLEIIGTTYLPEFAAVAPLVLAASLVGGVILRKSKLNFFN